MKYEKGKYGIGEAMFDCLVRWASEDGDKSLLPFYDARKSQKEIRAVNMDKAFRAMRNKGLKSFEEKL